MREVLSKENYVGKRNSCKEGAEEHFMTFPRAIVLHVAW